MLFLRQFPKQPNVRTFGGPAEGAALLGAICVLFLASVVGGGPNTMQWDNFEFLIPLIKATHEQWLRGQFPLFAFDVHMGEAILANGQAGVFYWPYTLALMLTKITGADARGFATAVFWEHAALGALGWFYLLRAAGVGRAAAGLTALGIAGGGLYQINTSVWIDMAPAFTWFGWTAFGVHRLARGPATVGDVLILTLAVASMGWSGHPQMITYYALGVVLFAGAYLAPDRPPVARLVTVGACGLAGALLASPAVLPILTQLGYSGRTAAFPADVFAERSTNLTYLAGLLTPSLNISPAFLDLVPSTILLYQGAWVGLGLIGGVIALFRSRKERSVPDDVRRVFTALLFAGGILFWLALGADGGVYPLTRAIPVWSSFRWPFKLYYFALPALAAAAGCGLDLLGRTGKRHRLIAAAVVTASSIVTLAWFGAEWSALTAAVYLTGLGVPLVFAAANSTRARAAAAALGFVHAALLVALIQTIHLHPYDEAIGHVGAREFGIDSAARVLPLSVRPAPAGQPLRMQEFANLQSAMLNDYESATGCVTALNPAWRAAWIPADVFGVPYPPATASLVGGAFVDAYNIGYYVVGKGDRRVESILANLPHVRPHRDLAHARVYRNTRALPQVFWADEARALDPASLPVAPPPTGRPGEKDAPARVAYIEDLARPAAWARPPGDPVFRKTNRAVEVDLNNAAAGFLVLSYTWYPSWSAVIDDHAVPVFRVDGTIAGVEVPAGARRLTLTYVEPSLKWAGALFMVGCALIVITLTMLRRTRPRRALDSNARA